MMVFNKLKKTRYLLLVNNLSSENPCKSHCCKIWLKKIKQVKEERPPPEPWTLNPSSSLQLIWRGSGEFGHQLCLCSSSFWHVWQMLISCSALKAEWFLRNHRAKHFFLFLPPESSYYRIYRCVRFGGERRKNLSPAASIHLSAPTAVAMVLLFERTQRKKCLK